MNALNTIFEKYLNGRMVAVSAIPILLLSVGILNVHSHELASFNGQIENIWIFVFILFVSLYIFLQDSRTVLVVVLTAFGSLIGTYGIAFTFADELYYASFPENVSMFFFSMVPILYIVSEIRSKIVEKGKTSREATAYVYKNVCASVLLFFAFCAILKYFFGKILPSETTLFIYGAMSAVVFSLMLLPLLCVHFLKHLFIEPDPYDDPIGYTDSQLLKLECAVAECSIAFLRSRQELFKNRLKLSIACCMMACIGIFCGIILRDKLESIIFVFNFSEDALDFPADQPYITALTITILFFFLVATSNSYFLATAGTTVMLFGQLIAKIVLELLEVADQSTHLIFVLLMNAFLISMILRPSIQLDFKKSNSSGVLMTMLSFLKFVAAYFITLASIFVWQLYSGDFKTISFSILLIVVLLDFASIAFALPLLMVPIFHMYRYLYREKEIKSIYL